MNHEPLFAWDSENGTASCILTDGNRQYIGVAFCHEDDRDMMSEKTGYEIAFRRAKIDVWRAYREEVKSSLKALKNFYYSINSSSKYNADSYEAKMLKRQISLREKDLKFAKEIIVQERADLHRFITEKEAFYQKIRTRRGLGNKD